MMSLILLDLIMEMVFIIEYIVQKNVKMMLMLLLGLKLINIVAAYAKQQFMMVRLMGIQEEKY
jgi:hypothetical protein